MRENSNKKLNWLIKLISTVCWFFSPTHFSAERDKRTSRVNKVPEENEKLIINTHSTIKINNVWCKHDYMTLTFLLMCELNLNTNNNIIFECLKYKHLVNRRSLRKLVHIIPSNNNCRITFSQPPIHFILRPDVNKPYF